MQPPQTFARGNRFLSISRVRNPPSASCRAARAPHGPAPITATSHSVAAACSSSIVELRRSPLTGKSSAVRGWPPRPRGQAFRASRNRGDCTRSCGAPLQQKPVGPSRLDHRVAQSAAMCHIAYFAERIRGLHRQWSVDVDHGRPREDAADHPGGHVPEPRSAEVADEDQPSCRRGHFGEQSDGGFLVQVMQKQRAHHDVVSPGEGAVQNVLFEEPSRLDARSAACAVA